MSWSGMRGAVSLAAALALPLQTESGAAFPGRDLILFLTICVIFATLVVQGLTLPPLIVFLGVREEGHEIRMEELRARLEAARAVLARLDHLRADEWVPPSTRQRLRELYEERVRSYEAGLEAGYVTEQYEDSTATWQRWRRELFDVERAAVVSLRDKGEINSKVMRRVERDIDLEELRFGG